jgi:hypothetical protein
MPGRLVATGFLVMLVYQVPVQRTGESQKFFYFCFDLGAGSDSLKLPFLGGECRCLRNLLLRD